MAARCRDHLFACANPERRRCSSRSGMGIEIRALAGGSISPNRAEAVQGLSTLTTPILRRPKSLKSLVRLREPNSNCIILIYNDYLGSGLIDHSQNMTAAAIQIAEK